MTLEEAFKELRDANTQWSIKYLELQKENELLLKCLNELVESIYTPYRLGLAEKPNKNWEALNKAKECLAKLG